MNHYNCIYMYVNKINKKKYIGQAKNFNRRHWEHIHYANNICNDIGRYNLPIHCAIRKYSIENFEIIILKENLKTQCLLNLYECYYIKKHNTLAKNKNGYNLADGGHNGWCMAGKTEEEINEWKKKLSEKLSGENNPMYGKPCSEEKRKNISKSKIGSIPWNKGIETPDIIRQKISNTKSYSGRKIRQYDLNGNLMKIWNNTREVEEYLKISKGNISRACNGKLKSVKNSIWIYDDEFNEKILIEKIKNTEKETKKKICQYDLDGNLIKIWDSITEASKLLNINRCSISDCCRGKTKKVKCFIFKYLEE